MKKMIFCLVMLLAVTALAQDKLLIYMDMKQTNDLKAYGVAYYALQHCVEFPVLPGEIFMMQVQPVELVYISVQNLPIPDLCVRNLCIL